MVFSTDKLIKQENIDNTPIGKNIITVSENTSLFLDALQCMIEEDKLIAEELSKYTLDTYTSRRKLMLNEITINININPFKGAMNGIKAAGNGIYNFMKTNFTIEKIVKFIIHSFLKILSRIWREFEAICMNIVGKNSQIRRLESKIQSIAVPFQYNKPLFIYTHIREEKSETELEEQLDSIYNEITSFIDTFSKIKNSSREIEMAINDFNKSAYDDVSRLDETRGRLLGMNSPVYKEQYAEILFRYFRNNAVVASTENILNPDDIRIRLNNWKLMPRVIKGYEKDKNKLEKAGNKLVDNLEKNHLDKYLDNIPASTLDLYTKLITRYSMRIKDTCEIYLLYYANRLDAAKEELKTNTTILFELAKYIVREGL